MKKTLKKFGWLVLLLKYMKRFIYKTTNLINGKFYIGQHSTKKKMSESLSKKVLCIETNTTYSGLTEANQQTSVSIACISMACTGRIKTTGGFHWKFV